MSRKHEIFLGNIDMLIGDTRNLYVFLVRLLSRDLCKTYSVIVILALEWQCYLLKVFLPSIELWHTAAALNVRILKNSRMETKCTY